MGILEGLLHACFADRLALRISGLGEFSVWVCQVLVSSGSGGSQVWGMSGSGESCACMCRFWGDCVLGISDCGDFKFLGFLCFFGNAVFWDFEFSDFCFPEVQIFVMSSLSGFSVLGIADLVDVQVCGFHGFRNFRFPGFLAFGFQCSRVFRALGFQVPGIPVSSESQIFGMSVFSDFQIRCTSRCRMAVFSEF